MKNSIKFLAVFVLVVTGFTFTACDEIDDLTSVDFTSSLSDQFNLSFDESSEEAIDESLTFDLADNNSVSKYLNKLKEVDITKITYRVTKYSGDENLNLNVGFYVNGSAVVPVTNYNLKSELGNEFEITDPAILKTISTTLLSKKQVTLQLKGNYNSKSAATAELYVTVYFDATAKAL